MKKEKKKQSGLPLAIIVLVLIGVVGGAYWLYNSAPKTVSNTNRAANTANTARSPQVPANAPVGAPLGVNMLGSPTATVTLEEFADFQCPSCASVAGTMKQIQSLYGNRIKFIFRHFPLSMHDKAYDAALATEAAGMQGRFWDMQNQLFTNQQAWASNPNYKQMWVEYAQKIGIDPDKFQNDMAGSVARQRVDLDIARARALNVSSTPTLYINGRAVPFQQVNVDPLRQIIDAELQSSAGRSSSTPAGAVSPAPAATQGSTASSGTSDTNKTGGNSR